MMVLSCYLALVTGGESTRTPGALHVSGACAEQQTAMNTEFLPEGVTADKKLYYRNEDGTRYLYFDKDCDGKGSAPPFWAFGGKKPSITAASDLDGDGNCVFSAYTAASSELPPESASWTIGCAEGWTPVVLSIIGDTYDGFHICPQGAFCQGDGCETNSTSDTPRDRWNPIKVCQFNVYWVYMYIACHANATREPLNFSSLSLSLSLHPPFIYFLLFLIHPTSAQPAAVWNGNRLRVNHLQWVQIAAVRAVAVHHKDVRRPGAAAILVALKIASCLRLRQTHVHTATMAIARNRTLARLVPTVLTAVIAVCLPVHVGIGTLLIAPHAPVHLGVTLVQHLTSAARTWV